MTLPRDADEQHVSPVAPPRDQTIRPLPESGELRQEAISALAKMLLLASLFLLAAFDFFPFIPFGQLWAAIIWLAGSAVAVLWTARRQTGVAGVLLVGTLGAFCVGETALFGGVVPLFALPLVVVAAGASLGSRAGFATAAVADLAILGLARDGPHALPVQEWLAPFLFNPTAATLIWLGNRPLQVALDWAWGSYSRMLELTVLIRRHQAELADTLRNLNYSYYQLERTTEELARARAFAEDAFRLKTAFASNISHELRTPLNLIIGFSEMMLFAPHTHDHQPLPSSYRGDTEAIYRNAQHLSELIDDVLELGEIEVGRMGLHKGWVGLGEIVNQAVAVLDILIQEKGLGLAVRVPEDLPPIYIDRTRVRQVLINLLNNAIRFTDQGSISISAHSDGRDIIVAVSDTGIGIRPDDMPHAFEEFRQFVSAQHRKAGGSGLGLSVCKRFVELHGGNIWVESTFGQGTTFRFTLPLSSNVAGLPMRADWETWARPPAGPTTHEPALLVRSSDAGHVRILQRHLDGFRVVTERERGDLPETTVWQAIIRVVDQTDQLEPNLKDLVTGANTRTPQILCQLPSERDLREELGVADYLVKPFPRERLLAALDRVPACARTVLVVDDDPPMAELIGQMLLSSGRGYRVIKAYDGESALEILRQPEESIDLLILDLLLPSLDGLAVLRELKADPRLAGLPVVVESAQGFIDRGLTSSVLAVTRGHGLSIRELTACIRSVLQTLDSP